MTTSLAVTDVLRAGSVLRQLVQGGGFVLLQSRELRRAARGATAIYPEVGDRYLTTVVRLPLRLANCALSAVSQLPTAENHYVYPAADLHLTVLNLDRSDRTVPERVQLAAEALQVASPFAVTLRGLGISSQSLYAKVYDNAGALGALRRRVAAATDSRASLPVRLLGFVDLMRFRSTDIARLTAAVRALRRLPLGTLQVRTVEIVSTDRLLSRAETTMLQRVDLGGKQKGETNGLRGKGR